MGDIYVLFLCKKVNKVDPTNSNLIHGKRRGENGDANEGHVDVQKFHYMSRWGQRTNNSLMNKEDIFSVLPCTTM